MRVEGDAKPISELTVNMSRTVRPGWQDKALRHWKKWRPKMVRRLEKNGMLEKALEYADEQTLMLYLRLTDSGTDPYIAKSEAMRKHLLFPAEDDEEILDVDLMPYGRPSDEEILKKIKRVKSALRKVRDKFLGEAENPEEDPFPPEIYELEAKLNYYLRFIEPELVPPD
ncbi:MAG: hypothetical protein ACE5FC_07040 [Myxococcota bacterium]